MKTHILPALKLTGISIVVFCGLYSLIILGFAQIAPNKGEGQTVVVDGKVKGYALEGQGFTQDKYFNGRPSAAGYNAAGSSGSNKGPTNPDYLKQVQDRIDSFLVHNPTVKKADIPSDLVTSSGSGLDPNITVQSALVQVDRIAKARKLSAEQVTTLVNSHIEKPLAGLLGTEKINVLALNVDLDKIK
ncbi:K(+)-transporting ATPase subunit C [Parasediminibacterium sp. JCM 36343]|uniref:K(+)-transporting ATPase subunit C n=1 Tax=Parasediminibacterium sp. JCM 36343 TaxID=3374279 RepID=UPI00397DCF0E